MKKKKKLWPWIVILAVFTALMIVDIILWCTSGSESKSGWNFPGGTMPEMSTAADGSTDRTRPERSTSESGSKKPERSTSENGSDRKRPEGFDGSNLPEGFDGSSRPSFDGSSFPEDFDGSSRPSFGGNSTTGDSDAGSLPEGFSRNTKSESWLSKLYLPVLIGCIVMDIFALVMLILAIRSNKKDGNGPDGGESSDNGNSEQEGEQETKAHKTLAKKIIACSVVTLLAALSIVLVILTKKKEASDESVRADESIVEASAKETSMSSKITAGGSISEEAEVQEYYPTGLVITDYLVAEGDKVAAGDPIAEVDRVSVMKTVTEIQEVIASLDSRLEALSEEKSDELLSTAEGRIKKIYAEAGKTVVDTVKEYGALMLISLDGNMAVDIKTDEAFTIGEKVTVILENEEVTGSVASLKEDMVTFTIDDSYGSIGEAVSVARNDSTVGRGELYIHQELAVTGYEGVIDELLVAENDVPEKGDALLRLKEETYSAEYDKLLAQRERLLSQMKSMFELYQSGVIVAQHAGEVTSLQDLTLTAGGLFDNVRADKLSNSPTGEDDSGYTNFAVLITAVDENEFQIKMSANPIGDIDLTMVDYIGKAICTNAGTVSKSQFNYVYGYNGTEWILQDVNAIQEGEIIVVSFDAQGNVIWAVRAEKSSETEVPDTTDVTDGTTGEEDAGTPGEITGEEGSVTPGETTGEEGSGKPAGEEGSGRPTKPDGSQETDGTDTSEETDGTEGSTDKESSGRPSGQGGSGSSGFPGGTGSSGTSGSSGRSGMSGFPGGSGSASIPGSSSGSFGTDSTMPEVSTGKSGSAKETVYAVEEVSVIGITPIETMDIEVTVDELDITNITVGQSCEVTFDAINAKSFEGSVKAIDTTGENDGGNTKYTVTVTLKREENMYPGMNTHITFSYGEKEKTKVIPESALYEEAGKTYVYTGYDKEKDELTGKKEVTTGLADGENVEILSGLSEDDKVYYRYADSLTISPMMR